MTRRSTPATQPDPSAVAPAGPPEAGFALILTLIFSILIYAIVADLVTTARTSRLTGENDALIARMDNHMLYCLSQVEELLLTDLAAAAAEEGGDGGGGAGAGLGGMLGGAGGDPAGGDPAAEEEAADSSAQCDGSQDAWYEPTAYTDSDLTTYVWVEDENSKFNVLSLVSPDREFADESKERFVRLIDGLRQGTEFDLTRADGETLADQMRDWMRSRFRNDALPRPPLKSDRELEEGDVSLPLQLEEFLLLRDVTEDMFADKVLDGRLIHGLDSVLTVYTSYGYDKGDPNDPNSRNITPAAGAAGSGEETTVPPEAPPGPGDPPPQPDGVGILININTAPRPVLRALFSETEFPDSVLDAILRWRNEPVDEEGEEAFGAAAEDYLGLVEGGEQVKRKVFTSLDELDEIPEFMNMANTDIKEKFRELVGVHSDVFTIHMASIYKRNEERRVFVMRRARSILIRVDDGEDGLLHPIVLLEPRHGLRVRGDDFPDETAVERFAQNDQMDAFSQEEKAWNPFLLDFYLPQEDRERLYSYRFR